MKQKKYRTCLLYTSDYTIRIYDKNPLISRSSAKLLAEGTANNTTVFTTVMDLSLIHIFHQRVIVSHVGFDRPTVIVTEGYGAAYALNPKYREEISELLDANTVYYTHLQWSNVTYMPCTAENDFIPEIPDKRIDIVYLCYPNNPRCV